MFTEEKKILNNAAPGAERMDRSFAFALQAFAVTSTNVGRKHTQLTKARAENFYKRALFQKEDFATLGRLRDAVRMTCILMDG